MIAAQLREDIVVGAVPPGSWLSQDQIATRFGVSHTPVREAFKALEAEGLVEYAPYRGVRVVEMTPRDISLLFGARELLEATAVREAVPRIHEATLTELDSILEHMHRLRQPNQAEQRRELNARFHELTWRACGSHYLIRLLTLVWALIPEALVYEGIGARQRKQWDQWMKRDDRDHEEVLAALREGDVARAVAGTREHIRHSAEEMETVLGVGSTGSLMRSVGSEGV